MPRTNLTQFAQLRNKIPNTFTRLLNPESTTINSDFSAHYRNTKTRLIKTEIEGRVDMTDKLQSKHFSASKKNEQYYEK